MSFVSDAGPHPRATMPRGAQQGGYTYMVILLMLTMAAISLTALVPDWKTAIQREREGESIYRAKQYAMGVRRYYHKFGAYPPSMDRLKETNNIRFLRRAWPDPLTADGEWRVLHVGDLLLEKSGGPGKTVDEMNQEHNSPGGANAARGNTASAEDQASDDSENADAAGGAASPSPAPQNTLAAPGSSAFGGFSRGGFGPGAGFSPQQGSGFGPPPGAGIGGVSPQGPGGQVFGGAGIVGVASKNNRPAIHEINKKTRPSQWRIVYDPSQDLAGFGVRPVGNQQPLNNQLQQNNQLQRPVMTDVPPPQ